MPWNDNLAVDNTMRAPEEPRRRFEPLAAAREVTVYCGSGISFCNNILAMRQAGIDTARLYPGSWGDWRSYPDLPVERGSGKVRTVEL